jgi:hypothetical protein
MRRPGFGHTLVVPVWLGGLVVALAWLRHLQSFGDPAFTAARMFALGCACYLLVATIVNVALAVCRVHVRLPLVPLLVVASLTAPIASTPAFASTAPPPVMHRVGPATAPPPTIGPSGPDIGPQGPKVGGGVPRTVPAPTVPTMWRVRHGDCFWEIARRVLTARLGRAPTNAEVAGYWRPLIEANRALLAHPANPSLLFVGQELLLP